MVQANELRIGNLVNEDVLGWVKVSQIFENSASLEGRHMNADRTIVPCFYTILFIEISPISLSPEILEKLENDNNQTGIGTMIRGNQKCRWEFNYNKIFLNERGEYELAISTDDFGGIVEGIKLTSLHHLQNIHHALTSEELNIHL